MDKRPLIADRVITSIALCYSIFCIWSEDVLEQPRRYRERY